MLGSPRSGTTLVRRFLTAHPRIHCPPETNLLNASARFLQEHPFANGLSVGVLSGLAFSGIAEESVIERLRDFILGFFREIATAAGKDIWAEKTAADCFYLDAIEQLLGERCKYVCVFRHPLDAACSMKELSDKMERPLPELHTYMASEPNFYLALARAWCDANSRLLRFIDDHPEACVSCRYEDLVADPVSVMGRVFHELGLPVDMKSLAESALGDPGEVGLGDWKTYTRSGVDASSVGRWSSISPHTVRGMLDIVGETMDRLGYERPKLPKLFHGDEARRRYAFGFRLAGIRTQVTEE